MKQFPPLIFLFLVTGLLAGCGTFSHLRPADTLKKGQFELAGGLSMNTLPEFVPTIRADYGLFERFEIGAQWELYTILGGFRYGLMPSDRYRIAVATGFQMGMISLHETSDDTTRKKLVFVPSLTVGKKLGVWDLYTGLKIFYLPSESFQSHLLTWRTGFRFPLYKEIRLNVEGGLSFHRTPAYLATLGEFTLGASFAF